MMVDMDLLLVVRSILFVESGSSENRTQLGGLIRATRTTSPQLPHQSGASESNRNPPAPKAGVLPSAPPPEVFQSHCSSPYGTRTHLSALKGQYPSPIDERAESCFVYAHHER